MTNSTSFREITFSDSDIVNINDWNPATPREQYPYKIKPWLFHEHGIVVAVVFAESLQDALDEAVDGDKLDRFMIAEADYADYGIDTEQDDGVAYLGNASEPFDIESLECLELPNPPSSFCALFEQFCKEKKA